MDQVAVEDIRQRFKHSCSWFSWTRPPGAAKATSFSGWKMVDCLIWGEGGVVMPVCGNEGAVPDRYGSFFEERAEPSKTLHLLVCLQSDPHLWSCVLGSD